MKEVPPSTPSTTSFSMFYALQVGSIFDPSVRFAQLCLLGYFWSMTSSSLDISCAKPAPPGTFSRSSLTFSHLIHLCAEAGGIFDRVTFTALCAKCHPQAVDHSFRSVCHAALVTTWVTFFLPLVWEVAQSWRSSGSSGIRMGHGVPGAGAGVCGASALLSFASLSLSGLPGGDDFPAGVLGDLDLLSASVAVHLSRDCVWLMTEHFASSSVMSFNLAFIGLSCNASSIYRKTAELFHRPKNEMSCTSIPFLV